MIITTISNLIFLKALEKGGEQLGEAVSKKIAQLINVIREKFRNEGIEGNLIKVQENPSDRNKRRFERELAELMEDDGVFAQKLKTLLEELKSSKQINQIFFKSVTVKGDAEIGDVEQTTPPGISVRQEAVTRSEIDGDLKIGDIKQKG